MVGLCGLFGFAWAAGLRGFMTEIAQNESNVSWSGTFGWVLLPGLLLRRCWDGQEGAPVLERPMAGEGDAAPLVGASDQSEEQLRAGLVQWREANLIDQDDIVFAA